MIARTPEHVTALEQQLQRTRAELDRAHRRIAILEASRACAFSLVAWGGAPERCRHDATKAQHDL